MLSKRFVYVRGTFDFNISTHANVSTKPLKPEGKLQPSYRI